MSMTICMIKQTQYALEGPAAIELTGKVHRLWKILKNMLFLHHFRPMHF